MEYDDDDDDDEGSRNDPVTVKMQTSDENTCLKRM
jgi:hypothetical protein